MKEAGKKKNNHACEEQGYANLQSPNSKSPKLGCNAEDEPMLKREAEFSSHTIALPPCLSGAAQCQNMARAVRRTHARPSPQPATQPRRGISSTAGAFPLVG